MDDLINAAVIAAIGVAAVVALYLNFRKPPAAPEPVQLPNLTDAEWGAFIGGEDTGLIAYRNNKHLQQAPTENLREVQQLMDESPLGLGRNIRRHNRRSV